MQNCSLVRQILERRQHPSNLVSVTSHSLQRSATASLVERYVVNCLQGREANPVLLVTSQPGFDLPVSVSDMRIRGHQIALRCSSKANKSRGGRFLFGKQDQPLLAEQGPDTYEVKAEVSAAAVDKIVVTFAVKKNLYWRAVQTDPPQDLQILKVEQQVHGKFWKIWLTLDHPLECNTSDSATIIISIHNLPCLTGQKQVEDMIPGDSRCSIKRNQYLPSEDLLCMQQACNRRSAFLVQDAQVQKTTEVCVYEIQTCNGSGLEVKDPQALKAWTSSLVPTDTPAASLSVQHAVPQQLNVHDQQTQQTAPQHPQPPPEELPATVPSSNKRSRTSCGIYMYARGCCAEKRIDKCLFDLQLQSFKLTGEGIILACQGGLHQQRNLMQRLKQSPQSCYKGQKQRTLPGGVPTTAQAAGSPVQLSVVQPSDVQLSDETFQELHQLMDMMDDQPSNTLPGVRPCPLEFKVSMLAESLKYYVSRALFDLGPAGCPAARLAEARWPEQYPKGDDDGARMKKSSMVIKVSSVLFNHLWPQRLVKVKDGIWTFQDSTARLGS